MQLVLQHPRGQLGPYTIERWAAPNGEDCLLIWMLKEIERECGPNAEVELLSVETEEAADAA